MEQSGFIFVFQVGLVLVAMPVAVLSLLTSRRKHLRHGSLMAVAMVLIALALLGLMATVVMDITMDEPIDWVILSAPALTVVLCAVPIIRSTMATRRHARSKERHASAAQRH